MATCVYCGKETGLPNPDTCNLCHDLIAHLPRFLLSREGQHLVANALEGQRNKERNAAFDAKVAAFDGSSIEELETMIAGMRHLKSQLVGNLYPGILGDEVLIIEEAIKRKKALHEHDVQTSPEIDLN